MKPESTSVTMEDIESIVFEIDHKIAAALSAMTKRPFYIIPADNEVRLIIDLSTADNLGLLLNKQFAYERLMTLTQENVDLLINNIQKIFDIPKLKLFIKYDQFNHNFSESPYVFNFIAGLFGKVPFRKDNNLLVIALDTVCFNDEHHALLSNDRKIIKSRLNGLSVLNQLFRKTIKKR